MEICGNHLGKIPSRNYIYFDWLKRRGVIYLKKGGMVAQGSSWSLPSFLFILGFLNLEKISLTYILIHLSTCLERLIQVDLCLQSLNLQLFQFQLHFSSRIRYFSHLSDVRTICRSFSKRRSQSKVNMQSFTWYKFWNENRYLIFHILTVLCISFPHYVDIFVDAFQPFYLLKIYLLYPIQSTHFNTDLEDVCINCEIWCYIYQMHSL